jgi:urease accessory protein
VHDAALLQLLHLADSALPIGAAAHSFGLETLAEEGVLRPESIERFLEDYLEEAGSLEASYVGRAWRIRTCAANASWSGEDMSPLNENASPFGDDERSLSDEFGARRPARESREASLKLGRRFAELVTSVSGHEIPRSHACDLHYCVAFGVGGAALAIPQRAVVLAYLQQSMAAMISACQRLMPLGQIAATRILWNLKPAIMRAATAEAALFKGISCFTPLPELASMRHGSIETRLFIS